MNLDLQKIRVKANGSIELDGHNLFIGEPFQDQFVVVHPSQSSEYVVIAALAGKKISEFRFDTIGDQWILKKKPQRPDRKISSSKMNIPKEFVSVPQGGNLKFPPHSLQLPPQLIGKSIRLRYSSTNHVLTITDSTGIILMKFDFDQELDQFLPYWDIWHPLENQDSPESSERRVDATGRIPWHGHLLFISLELQGKSVQIIPHDHGIRLHVHNLEGKLLKKFALDPGKAHYWATWSVWTVPNNKFSPPAQSNTQSPPKPPKSREIKPKSQKLYKKKTPSRNFLPELIEIGGKPVIWGEFHLPVTLPNQTVWMVPTSDQHRITILDLFGRIIAELQFDEASRQYTKLSQSTYLPITLSSSNDFEVRARTFQIDPTVPWFGQQIFLREGWPPQPDRVVVTNIIGQPLLEWHRPRGKRNFFRNAPFSPSFPVTFPNFRQHLKFINAYLKLSILQIYYHVSYSREELFFRFLQTFPLVKQSRKYQIIPLFCASLFHLSCKSLQMTVNLSNLLQLWNLRRGDLFQCVKIIRTHSLFQSSTQLSQLYQLYLKVDQCLDKLQVKFQFPKRMIRTAKALTRQFRPFLGEIPSIIAATALMVVVGAIQCYMPPLIPDICKELQCTPSTVYSRLRTTPKDKMTPIIEKYYPS